MRARRYRAVVCFIPLFLIVYVAVVALKPQMSNTRDVAFPVFSWALFAATPPWIAQTNVAIAHSVDGRTVQRYVIPARSSSDLKSLNQAVAHCKRRGHAARPAGRQQTASDCDEKVKALLYPIITRLAGGESVEFTIATESIDLRGVRDGIHDIARGDVSKTSYLTRQETFGRWSTVHGRVSQIPISLDSTNLVFESRFDGYLGPCGIGRVCLTFAKTPCGDADLLAPFFLNIYPRDVRSLPEALQPRGFEAVRFDANATRAGERCSIARPLPGYHIGRIETGQYRPGLTRVWTEVVYFPAPDTAADG